MPADAYTPPADVRAPIRPAVRRGRRLPAVVGRLRGGGVAPVARAAGAIRPGRGVDGSHVRAGVLVPRGPGPDRRPGLARPDGRLGGGRGRPGRSAIRRGP